MTTSQDLGRPVLKTKPLALRRFQLMALEHIEKRAARIKAQREELGLSQEALADRMQEVHAERFPDREPDQTRGQMVSDWERAVNEPSPRKLELLALALETSVAALSTDAPDKNGSIPDPFGQASPGATSESGAVAGLRAQMMARSTAIRASTSSASSSTSGSRSSIGLHPWHTPLSTALPPTNDDEIERLFVSKADGPDGSPTRRRVSATERNP